MSEHRFAERLLAWFDDHGRHDLPWQRDPTPYRVWVSEVMLQQTQVTTVIPYFERFMADFPTVRKLAAASIDQVLSRWSGLGYYARGRNLHKAAQQIVELHGGRCPDTLDDWLALPGVGRSTAGAILALSLGQRHAILDGNVKRVLSRYAAIAGYPAEKKVADQLWALSETLTPHERVREYTQAIMDLGATLCARTRPACRRCPQLGFCAAERSGEPTAFPGKKPRKEKPVQRRQVLILQNPRGEVLLEQRPPSGIWGGLWSFPELEEAQDAQLWLAEQGLAQDAQPERWPVVRHTFTHYHLDMLPVCATLKLGASVQEGQWLWYNADSPAELGLAAPVQKLIHAVSGNRE